jgi:glucosyl-dolichyl phosphate glucuronosyltransferase
VHIAKFTVGLLLMKYTIAFSTCKDNRMDWVLQILRSLNYQKFKDFEVLIIVNQHRNYFENLARRIDETKNLSFNVKLFFTKKNLGIAHDRNIALQEAVTDFVAYTDDDAVPDKNWLKMIDNSFRNYESAGAITGPVLANWSKDIADSKTWFPKELYWVIGCTQIEHQNVTEVRNGFASNLALNRKYALNIGGFNEKFGYNKEYPMAGEEPDFCLRLKEYGKLTLWNPQAMVFHRITANRLVFNNILTRSYIEGRTKAYLRKVFGQAALGTEKDQVKVIAKALLAKGPMKNKLYLAMSTSAVIGGYLLTEARIRSEELLGVKNLILSK